MHLVQSRPCALRHWITKFYRSYEKGKLGGGFVSKRRESGGIGGAKFGDKNDVVCTWTDAETYLVKISVASSISAEDKIVK